METPDIDSIYTDIDVIKQINGNVHATLFTHSGGYELNDLYPEIHVTDKEITITVEGKTDTYKLGKVSLKTAEATHNLLACTARLRSMLVLPLGDKAKRLIETVLEYSKVLIVSGEVSPVLHKLVFISGKPRSGKDTVGDILHKHSGYILLTPGDIIKDQAHKHLGLDVKTHAFEDCKDEPNELFNGETPRRYWQYYAEQILKVKEGEDIVGRLILEEILGRPAVYAGKKVAIIGAGFKEEVAAIAKAAKHCSITNLVITRDAVEDIYDTREEDFDHYTQVTVSNNGTFEELRRELVKGFPK